MFRAGDTWKHMSCLDICIFVVKRQYSDAKRIKLKVMYANTRGMIISARPENITIKRQDVWKWRLVK